MENLIEKYKRRHRELYSLLDSEFLNTWQEEMIKRELEVVTEFLRDLRLLQHNDKSAK